MRHFSVYQDIIAVTTASEHACKHTERCTIADLLRVVMEVFYAI